MAHLPELVLCLNNKTSHKLCLSQDDDDKCTGYTAKVLKQYAAGKSGKTKQAKAHYDIDPKAEKIIDSKGAKKARTNHGFR